MMRVRHPRLELEHLGISEHPGGPTDPPDTWRSVPASAYTIVKANRAWYGVEHVSYGLGASPGQIARLRAISMVVASTVYGWDALAETDQARREASDHTGSADTLTRVLTEIGVGSAGVLAEVEGIRRLFELELMAARGPDDVIAVWRELSPHRSADIRLQVRVAQLLLDREREQILRCLRPLMEVLEILDDLESSAADRAAGSYNTYWFLRSALAPGETRDLLLDFTDDRISVFHEASRTLSTDDARALSVLLLRPRSVTQARLARSLSLLGALGRSAIARTVTASLRPQMLAALSNPDLS